MFVTLFHVWSLTHLEFKWHSHITDIISDLCRILMIEPWPQPPPQMGMAQINTTSQTKALKVKHAQAQ